MTTAAAPLRSAATPARPGAWARRLPLALGTLALFGWLLSLTDVESAGRAFAVYGGIYIAASLVWLRAVEGVSPDRWDLIGGAGCIAGALIILYGPRHA